jgi:hypothetical protein
MLAWVLQTAELAAKEGMAATKRDGLLALLQVSIGGATGAATGIMRLHLGPHWHRG